MVCGRALKATDHPRITASTPDRTSDPAQANTPPWTRQPHPRTSPVVTMVLAALRCVGIARPKPKPFYTRWWFRAPAVLAVLLIFGAANNFGDPPTKASSTRHQSGVALGGTTSAQAAPASAPVKPSDQGWVLDSYRLSDHARGDFGGTVRITNTNKGAQSAVFTVFVLVKGREVASLQEPLTVLRPGRLSRCISPARTSTSPVPTRSTSKQPSHATSVRWLQPPRSARCGRMQTSPLALPSRWCWQHGRTRAPKLLADQLRTKTVAD
jgi:hypothetical protein